LVEGKGPWHGLRGRKSGNAPPLESTFLKKQTNIRGPAPGKKSGAHRHGGVCRFIGTRFRLFPGAGSDIPGLVAISRVPWGGGWASPTGKKSGPPGRAILKWGPPEPCRRSIEGLRANNQGPDGWPRKSWASKFLRGGGVLHRGFWSGWSIGSKKKNQKNKRRNGPVPSAHRGRIKFSIWQGKKKPQDTALNGEGPPVAAGFVGFRLGGTKKLGSLER